MKKYLLPICLLLALQVQAEPIFDQACSQSNKATLEEIDEFFGWRCPNPKGIVKLNAYDRVWTGTFVKDENFFTLIAEPGASKHDSHTITYTLINAKSGQYLNVAEVPKVKSTLVHVATDCVNKRKRPIKFEYFSENFGSGNLLAEYTPYEDWQSDPGYTSIVCVNP